MAKVKVKQETQRPTHIRAWRKSRNLTLEAVAERIGVTAGALSQLERGDVGYTQAMLEALADVLQCEPADLIAQPPDTENALTAIWSSIPIEERHRALNVLKAFLKAPSEPDL